MTDEYQVALAELERFVSHSPVAARAFEVVKAEHALLEDSGADVADDASKCIVDLAQMEADLQRERAARRVVDEALNKAVKERGKLIQVVRAQHHAIDMLFATLIYRTKDQQTPFYPSKSGEPWDACQRGAVLMNELGEPL